MCFGSSWPRTPCSSSPPQPPEAEAVHEAVVKAEVEDGAEAEAWPAGKDQLALSCNQLHLHHRQPETWNREKLKQTGK